MTFRRYWSIALWSLAVVGAIAIYLVGPTSPRGRYHIGNFPPMPTMGGPDFHLMHTYLQLSDGKAVIHVGTNAVEFGEYYRKARGWELKFGREDYTKVVTLQCRPTWFLMNVTNSQVNWKWKRCFHYWK